MKTETEYAVSFLLSTICNKLPSINGEQMVKLQEKLTLLLTQRFEGHWYPEKPIKGSAYRCMNINIDDGSIDAVLRKAFEETGFNVKDLFVVFNKGLALWVDPNDVSCKLGKGAIFPIYRKIADRNTTEISGEVPKQHRPQQRPRSISPPQSTMMHQQHHYLRSRSTTPPGFSSNDAGQLFQNVPTSRQRSLENIHKLWDTLPNTTISNVNYMNQTSAPSYTASTQAYNQQKRNDAVYSFNQYSSYYKPNTSYWKKNTQAKQQSKPLWQSDEVYNRYHWSKSDTSSMVNQTYSPSYSSYAPSRQAQEVY